MRRPKRGRATRAPAGCATGKGAALSSLTITMGMAESIRSQSAAASAAANNATVTTSTSSYDATFTATGGDDAAALKSFIEAHRGDHVLVEGTVRTSGGAAGKWTLAAGATTTVDFAAGAKLQNISTTGAETLALDHCWDLVINDYTAIGSGWDGTYYPLKQWEHGIAIQSGGRITLNNPDIRDTKGDGICVEIVDEFQDPPVDIVVNNPTIYQTNRNGITPNAGELSVSGGTIDKSGLHNIDMEPNYDSAATSIDVTIDGMRLTNADVLFVYDNPGDPDITGRAMSGLGYSSARKIAIRVTNCSADRFTMVLDGATTCVFTGNSSDEYVTGCGAPAADPVFLSDMTNLTVSGNSNMCINTTYDVRS